MANPKKRFKFIGRPPIFSSEEDIVAAIEVYFNEVALTKVDDIEQFNPTISGLAYHLGMSTETLRRYGKKDKFCAIVKRAKQVIEMHLEGGLGNSNATGIIFNLKCNYNWDDKSEKNTTIVFPSVMPVPTADSVEDWEKVAKKNQEDMLSNG